MSYLAILSLCPFFFQKHEMYFGFCFLRDLGCLVYYLAFMDTDF